MSKTRLELVNQAAKRLGELAAGQTLSDEDYDEINGLWEPLCGELQARNIFTVMDPEEVQDPEFLSLADLLAIRAAPTFGLTSDNLSAKGLVKAAIEDDLKVIAAGPATKSVLTIEPFWGGRRCR